MDIDLDSSMTLPKSLFGQKNDKTQDNFYSPISLKNRQERQKETPKKDNKSSLGSISPFAQTKRQNQSPLIEAKSSETSQIFTTFLQKSSKKSPRPYSHILSGKSK